MLSNPHVFSIIGTPSYGVTKSHGADLVAENKCMNVIEHIEVELDATSKAEFLRIAHKAKELYEKYQKPIRLWLVASSDKWVKGVEKEIKNLGETFPKNISVKRISPIRVGEGKFPF